MFKKIMVLLIALAMLPSVFLLSGCEKKDKELMEILKQFDLTDPKEIWEGSIEDNFADDLVLLVLRKTSTFPELELRHFGLDNAESMYYLGGARPPDYFFTTGYEEVLKNYRQIVFIKLNEHGKEKVIEAIIHLETLGFVKSADPNGFDNADT
jgi:hypothetical protein